MASINSMYLRLYEIFLESVGLLHSRTVSSLYFMFEGEGDDNNNDSNAKARQTKAKTIASLVREM